MTDLRKAAEMALKFVDWLCGDDHSVKPKNKALDVREALRQALAQPEQGNSSPNYPISESITTFVDAVNMRQERVDETAKREHEPVAWFIQYEHRHEFLWRKPNELEQKTALEIKPLYTAPPKRKWVGLTEADKSTAIKLIEAGMFNLAFKYLEEKLKEKNYESS